MIEKDYNEIMEMDKQAIAFELILLRDELQQKKKELDIYMKKEFEWRRQKGKIRDILDMK